MGRIVIRGDEEVMVEELSKYVSRDGARVFVRSLLALNNVIDDDEKIEIVKGKDGQKNSMGFMIPKTNYYINLKMTTIAFIGLLLDIRFTEGFSSFALSVFGVTADMIRKLSNTAKCVLLLVKSGDILAEEDKYVLGDSVSCINFACNCDYRRYNRCSLSQEILRDTIRELLEKGIIKQKGNCLVYRF